MIISEERKKKLRLQIDLYDLTEKIRNKVEILPYKGEVSSECQRRLIELKISELEMAINGLEDEDFTKNKEL